ncbi:MAG: hypothetical protein HN884_14945 [Rhodospirillaceae bacterium]|nr:hypothetical protein [Rhodospirillaceae bacterium]
MTHPTIFDDGKNNWAKVNWDDPDIGEYTNLCPDKRRADFEYGSICIVEAAKMGPTEEMFSTSRRPPSKIKRDLEQLIDAFDRLSPDTIFFLKVNAGLTDPTKVMKDYLLGALNRVGKGKISPDRSRKNIGEQAWAIWVAHDGSLRGKEKGGGSDFETYVERLLMNVGFVSEDKKKNRVSVDNLVRSIKRASKKQAPQGWQLW